MNREIKFRAWHKLLNQMIQVDAIDFSGGTIRNSDPCVVEDKTNGGCYLLDNLVLMQYTGIKDINGVDIYEGDIVERRRERGLVDFNDRNYGEVIGWNLLQYQYVPFRKNWKKFQNKKEGWVYAEKGEDGELPEIEFYYGCPPDKSWEVVGNIFEGVE